MAAMKQNSSFGDHVPTAGCAGRLEVLDGPTGRRVRSEADRARIAAESLMPEVQVAAVARKHGATRRLAASPSSGTTGTAESMAPMFAPLMVDESSAPQRTMRPPNRRKREGGNCDRRHGDPNDG
ncbi:MULTISPECIES: hypothetical protein [Mesorhizobium]|uniref:hypothetical protein n=1 Tax=Mesorhizobium TaxID=68287 RepID=UPI0003186ED7|nr:MULTISPECIES: hypothetical protein [Mesorhizobium]